MSQAQYGRPFDANANYGEVFGSPFIAFEQGDQLYDAHKRPIDKNGNLMELDPARVVRKSASQPAPEAGDEGDDGEEDDDAVMSHSDFIAWYQGKRGDLQFFRVAKQIELRYGIRPKNSKEGRAILEQNFEPEQLLGE